MHRPWAHFVWKIKWTVPKERRCKPWTALSGCAAQSLPGTVGLKLSSLCEHWAAVASHVYTCSVGCAFRCIIAFFDVKKAWNLKLLSYGNQVILTKEVFHCTPRSLVWVQIHQYTTHARCWQCEEIEWQFSIEQALWLTVQLLWCSLYSTGQFQSVGIGCSTDTTELSQESLHVIHPWC